MPNMRRGATGGADGEQTPRFCPNCGAANTVAQLALHDLRATLPARPTSRHIGIADFSQVDR